MKKHSVWFVAAMAFGLTSCSRVDVATVTGKVKLNGKPLPKAEVTFIPEKGRVSTAVTEADGSYVLEHTGQIKGALIGKHKVKIKAYRRFVDEMGQGQYLPRKYNEKTTLTAEVKSGPNEINFDLKTR